MYYRNNINRFLAIQCTTDDSEIKHSRQLIDYLLLNQMPRVRVDGIKTVGK